MIAMRNKYLEASKGITQSVQPQTQSSSAMDLDNILNH
jgi:hypothetical protein